ncbi:MAG: universal stress protein [Thermoplasmata archaeon]|nr:universal stress protein [Thermoplasmata archaeon]
MSAPAISRIATAVDGSTYAQQGLALAIDLATRYHAELVILTVAPLTAYVNTTEPWIPTEVVQGEVQHYRAIVDASVAKAQGSGLKSVSGVCLEGHIAEEIIAYLDAHPVDLLIMGSRGLSTGKRMLLGSTSDQVLHHVRCAVLIVKESPSTPPSP